MFAGVFCFADDVVLLAPCASELRKMLSICSSYAASHGQYQQNSADVLLMTSQMPVYTSMVSFFSIPTRYLLHLGHCCPLNWMTKITLLE